MMLFKKKALSKEQEKRLIEAIQKAELKTSGEIRVHFDTVKVDAPIERAKLIFAKLKMDQTELRNGILFYINLDARQFAIWGDEGINAKVPENFWDGIKDTALNRFKENKISEGLEICISMCGDKLKQYFPLGNADKNELKNDISY